MGDKYVNPETGEVWQDGVTYKSDADWQAAQKQTASAPAEKTPRELEAEESAANSRPARSVGEAVSNLGEAVGGGVTDMGHSIAKSLALTRPAAHLASVLPGGPPYEQSLQEWQAPPQNPVAGGVGTAIGTLASGGLGKVAGALSKVAAPLLGKAAPYVANALTAGGAAAGGQAATAGEVSPETALAGVGGAGLGLAGTGAQDVFSRVRQVFPKLADALAGRLIGRAPAASALTLNEGQPGQLAEDVLNQGLNKGWTAMGRNQSAKDALARLGPRLEQLRAGRSVDSGAVMAELQSAMNEAPTPEAQNEIARQMARLRGGSVPGGDLYDKLVAQGVNPKMASSLAPAPPGGTKIPLQTLATRVAGMRSRVGDLYNARAMGNLQVDPEDIAPLRGVTEKLGTMAQNASTDPAAYPDVVRKYAVASEAKQGTAQDVVKGLNDPSFFRSTHRAMLNKTAQGVLGAYKASRGILPTLSEKLAESTPAAANAVRTALDSGNDVQAAVELHKAQGTDQQAREAVSPQQP